MPATVFGSQAVVTMMNLALNGSSFSLAPAAFASQVTAATANTTSYVNSIAGTFNAAYPTSTGYATLVLGNLGVLPNAALVTAVANYLDAVGIANRGVVTMQLGQILSGLEGDPTFGAAAAAWNSQVATSFANWSSTPGANFAMTATANETLNGTSGNDTFTGSSTTYQGGDIVNGNGGVDKLLLSLFAGTYNNVTLNDIDRVEIDADGDVTVTASKWSAGTDVVQITNKSTGVTIVNDLQEANNTGIKFELNDVASDVTFNFDQQAAQGDTTVEIMLTEVTGAVALQGENGEAIENAILNVQDLKNAASTLKSFTANGSKTLTINGGLAAQTFKITGALDGSLATVNAAAFVGNLDLNTSANTAAAALAFTGGSGDDKVNVGDGLGDGDVYNGGAGNNSFTAVFTTATDTTRAPTMSKFQSGNFTFNAPVSFEMAKVDDLATITVEKSGSRADFNQADSTLSVLNINGDLAQGVEVDYDGKADTTLNVNITGAAATVGNAGNKAAVRIINADTVVLTHQGTKNVTLSNGLQLDDQDANGRSTSSLTITNNSDFNMTINGMANENNPVTTVVADSDDVQSLLVQTNKLGDLFLGGSSVAFMEEADSLQTVVIKTNAVDGDIFMGLIGNQAFGTTNGGNPSDLESIEISAEVSTEIVQYGIDADDSDGVGASAATINTISVTGKASSMIELNGSAPGPSNSLQNAHTRLGWTGFQWLEAASIGTLTITSSGFYVMGNTFIDLDLDNAGNEDLDANNLIGLDLEAMQEDSTIIVSGSANVPGFGFLDDTAEFIDATGLTNTTENHFVDLNDIMQAAGYNVRPPSGPNQDGEYVFAVIAGDIQVIPQSRGFTFLGSEQDDLVMATDLADNLSGNGGDDLIIAMGENDVVNGGAGNDILYGDYIRPEIFGNGGVAGNDTIDGGAGNDIIIGGQNKAGGGDMLTGGSGSDTFVFVLDDDDLAGTLELGKSTASIKQDVITDFTPGSDTILIEEDGGGVGNSYAIAYYAGQGAEAVFINSGGPLTQVHVVIRRGNYNLNTLTFSLDANGADLQVLFDDDGDDFGGNVGFRLLSAAFYAGGGTDFADAEHELGLLGVAASFGSLDVSDIFFR